MSSCQTRETQQTTISSVFPFFSLFFSDRGSRYLYQTHALFWLKNKRPTSYLICWKSDLGSGTADTAPAHPILPLPTRYCPRPPIPSQTPMLSRFLRLTFRVTARPQGVRRCSREWFCSFVGPEKMVGDVGTISLMIKTAFFSKSWLFFFWNLMGGYLSE